MESKLTKNQERRFSKSYTENGIQYRIDANIRYGDECGNGHNTFSITGNIKDLDTRRADKWVMGGCIHEEIEKHFPELKKYIKWHLFNSNGPMYYLANTMYHASPKDCWGLLKGEKQPSKQIKTVVLFDNVPIAHKLDNAFAEFLRNIAFKDADIVAVGYVNGPEETYEFSPKYTLIAYNVVTHSRDQHTTEWQKCPLDTEEEAQQFLDAIKNCKVTFKTEPAFIRIGEGKEPELEAARSCAVWPDATLKQLQDKAQLELRLPQLIKDFRHDVEELGFIF